MARLAKLAGVTGNRKASSVTSMHWRVRSSTARTWFRSFAASECPATKKLRSVWGVNERLSVAASSVVGEGACPGRSASGISTGGSAFFSSANTAFDWSRVIAGAVKESGCSGNVAAAWWKRVPLSSKTPRFVITLPTTRPWKMSWERPAVTGP